MNNKTAALALVTALVLPRLANAQFILDTGIPSGSTGTFVLNSASSLAGEFAITAGTNVTQLSAYLTQGTNQSGTSFIFDIYSSLRTTGNRVSPVFTTLGTFTATGWNSATVNWTPTTTGDYWLALQASTPNAFDVPGEASTSTGTLPALAFASSSTSSDYYSTSGAPGIGLQITAAPEPSTWALLLDGLGLMAFSRVLSRRMSSAGSKSFLGRVLLALLGLFSLETGSANAQIIIADSTFNNSDWSASSIAVPPAPATTVSFAQVATGGNPGSYQQVSFNETTPGSDATYRAEADVIYTAQSYTPSIQGAALSITFSGDFQSSGTNTGFPCFFAEQNGIFYRDANLYLSTFSATWANFSDTTTTLENVAPGGPLNLSSSTSPIYFGVGLGEASGGPIITNYDLDNFKVTISTVVAPEPSSWMLLLSGLGVIAFWRMRWMVS